MFRSLRPVRAEIKRVQHVDASQSLINLRNMLSIGYSERLRSTCEFLQRVSLSNMKQTLMVSIFQNCNFNKNTELQTRTFFCLNFLAHVIDKLRVQIETLFECSSVRIITYESTPFPFSRVPNQYKKPLLVKKKNVNARMN